MNNIEVHKMYNWLLYHQSTNFELMYVHDTGITKTIKLFGFPIRRWLFQKRVALYALNKIFMFLWLNAVFGVWEKTSSFFL